MSDPRLRDNPHFVDDVHGAIDRQLQLRGLERAETTRADLLVHFHAAITDRIEVPARTERFAGCAGRDCPPDVTGYQAGTLVIDITDTWTNRLVWRGWAEHRLEDMLDDPVLVNRRVQDAVQRIMKRLPPTAVSPVRTQAPEVTR